MGLYFHYYCTGILNKLQLFNKNYNQNKNNLFDFQGLDIKEKAWMQVGQVPVDDVHLIVKQRRNEEWDQVASPRANRFIVHFEMASFVDESLQNTFLPQSDSNGMNEQELPNLSQY